MRNFEHRSAHWLGRQLNEAREWVVQLDNQNDSAGNRQGAEKQCDDCDGIRRSEQSEAGEDDGEPEDQENQERQGNTVAGARFQRPSCLNKSARQSQAK